MAGSPDKYGRVDISDALIVAQKSAGMNPSPFNATQADTNCNGQVSITDALRIAQYSAGLLAALVCN